MKFSELARYFEDIESTSSRNEMTEKLAILFKHTSAEEIGNVMYMLQGQVTPPFIKADFGLGEKMIVKAALKGLNIDQKLFQTKLTELGDIGLTVEKCKDSMPSLLSKDLTVNEVFKQLVDLTDIAGEGSQDKKLSIIAELIQTLDPLSCRYVVRIPAQTLRLGFSDMTILDALSWFLTGDKTLRKDIEKAYHVRPDLGYIATQIKREGIKGIEQVKPHIGTPILMMRAQRLPSPKAIVEKLSTAIIEPKYDGFRLQVHYKKNGKSSEVKLFSRGLDDVTFMYPDIVEGIKKEITADSLIIEGEAIGFEPYSGNFLPFQETVQRKRKYDIAEKALSIPLKMFAFEVLYKDGKSLLVEPYEKRMKLLHESIKTTGDILQDTLLPSEMREMNNEEDVQSAFDDAITKGLEGIMIKKKDGIYEPGARGWNWIKYKRSYSSKIDDTLDCLVMGFDTGKGKRTDFGIGAFLVGVYDAHSDTFKTVAKVGTGLSDNEWRTLREECSHIKTDHKPALYEVDKLMNVDEWVSPKIVVEIKADEITRSTMHTAGRIMQDSKSGKALIVEKPGFALRFPRLVRFRDDRKPEDATTVNEIEQMFEHFHKARTSAK